MASRFLNLLSLIASAVLFVLVLSWAVVEIRKDIAASVMMRSERAAVRCGDDCLPDQKTVQRATSVSTDCCLNAQPPRSFEIGEEAAELGQDYRND